VDIPLATETINALAAIPHESTYYFWTGTSTRKTCLNIWEEALRRLFDLSGVPDAHSHRLRHTFAVNLLQAGVSIESVTVLLGHRSIRITERHYGAWVQYRQDKLAADVRKTWATISAA
jgi:integrase